MLRRPPAHGARATSRGRADGRTVEIQRLIGRSLRAVVDFEALEAHTVYLDCDVLEADGGTRCAGITGAYVALQVRSRVGRSRQARADAADELGFAAGSWLVDDVPVLDLCYEEDVKAQVDMNVVMTGDGVWSRSRRRASASLLARITRRARPRRRRDDSLRRNQADATGGLP